MAGPADVAFIVVFASVLCLWWLDGHLIRRPGESVWHLYIAIKTDRRHAWPALASSLYLLAVLFIPVEGGSPWWLLLTLPAYGFLLVWWRQRKRLGSRPRWQRPQDL